MLPPHMTPNELYRIWRLLEASARLSDEKFMKLDAALADNGPISSNHRYLVSQAADYMEAIEASAGAEHDGRQPYRALARSEMSRFLAIALREGARQGWSFLDVLHDGVVYEADIVAVRTVETARYRGFAKHGLPKAKKVKQPSGQSV